MIEEEYEELSGYYHAMLSYKTTDGFSYWSLYDNHEISAEEVYPEVPLTEEETRALFAQIPEKFNFANGKGGWSTWVQISEDGTFIGNFHDSDMGVYTYYECDFSGRFQNVRRMSECVYVMELAELNLAEEPGRESVEDIGGGVLCKRIHK